MSLALSTDYTERLYMAMEKDNVSSVSAPLNSDDNVLDNDLLRNNLSTVPSCSYKYSGGAGLPPPSSEKIVKMKIFPPFRKMKIRLPTTLLQTSVLKPFFWHSPQLRPTTIIFLQYFGPFRCPKFETFFL